MYIQEEWDYEESNPIAVNNTIFTKEHFTHINMCEDNTLSIIAEVPKMNHMRNQDCPK